MVASRVVPDDRGIPIPDGTGPALVPCTPAADTHQRRPQSRRAGRPSLRPALAFSLAIASALAAGAVSPAQAAETARDTVPVRLTSLEWPPYTSATLPGGGKTTALVMAVFDRIGKQAMTEFLPWNRAVALALGDDGFSGVYPEYRIGDLSRCHWSAPIGRSRLVLVHRGAEADRFSRIDLTDLSSLRMIQPIAAVQGYVNREDFDTAAAQGSLVVEPVTSDTALLRVVAFGRVAAGVIDEDVYHHHLEREPDLRRRLAIQPGTFATHTLHVCFKPTAHGAALRDAFDAALATIDQPMGAPTLAPTAAPGAQTAKTAP